VLSFLQGLQAFVLLLPVGAVALLTLTVLLLVAICALVKVCKDLCHRMRVNGSAEDFDEGQLEAVVDNAELTSPLIENRQHGTSLEQSVGEDEETSGIANGSQDANTNIAQSESIDIEDPSTAQQLMENCQSDTSIEQSSSDSLDIVNPSMIVTNVDS